MKPPFLSVCRSAALCVALLVSTQSMAVDVDIASTRLQLVPANANPQLVMAQYRPNQNLLSVDIEQPIVCIPTGDSQPDTGQQLLMDGNALGGVAIGPQLRLSRSRYLPGPTPEDSLLELDLHPSTRATCFLLDAQPLVGVQPSVCGTAPWGGDPGVVFAGGFERPTEGVDVRVVRFSRDPNAIDRLDYTVEITLSPLAKLPASIDVREWFPADPQLYAKVLAPGTELGEVSMLRCKAYGNASCDGVEELSMLKGTPAVLALRESSILPGGCLRLTGRRLISSGQGAQMAPYGIGVTNHGYGDQTTVRWIGLP